MATKTKAGHKSASLERVVRRQFRRCNWMMQSKNWHDCGRKATVFARGTGMYYCEAHASDVTGWRYAKVPLPPKLKTNNESNKLAVRRLAYETRKPN